MSTTTTGSSSPTKTLAGASDLIPLLFDATIFSEPAAFGKMTPPKQLPEMRTGDTLKEKSPDNPRAGVLSVPLVNGVLAFAMGAVVEMGYVEQAAHQFVVRWHRHEDREIVHGVLDLAKAEIVCSSPDLTDQGITIGVLGVAAAFMQGVPTFKMAWHKFLVDAHATHQAVITDTTLGKLSDIVYGALRYGVSWPRDLAETGKAGQKLGRTWTFRVSPTLATVKVKQNIRNAFAEPDAFDTIMEVAEIAEQSATRFIGEQLFHVQRFIARRKHVALLGPAGTGKSICAFEALALQGFPAKGADYEAFSCHEEVKSSDLLGAWQPTAEPGKFVWVDGPLTRAMRGNGGRGKPILVEEFTRMPRKAQNVFITALSDGYLTLNEKPGSGGEGEVVMAGPDFVLLADMNVDPSVDDIEEFGAAFASRVRKLEYSYPSVDMLTRIVRSETKCTAATATAVGKIYEFALKLYQAHSVSTPVSPRSAVYWVQDYLDELEQGRTHREAAQIAATWTWLRDVCGTDDGQRGKILSEIEAAFRPIDLRGDKTAGKKS